LTRGVAASGSGSSTVERSRERRQGSRRETTAVSKEGLMDPAACTKCEFATHKLPTAVKWQKKKPLQNDNLLVLSNR
jgi:hypothetical protein